MFFMNCLLIDIMFFMNLACEKRLGRAVCLASFHNTDAGYMLELTQRCCKCARTAQFYV